MQSGINYPERFRTAARIENAIPEFKDRLIALLKDVKFLSGLREAPNMSRVDFCVNDILDVAMRITDFRDNGRDSDELQSSVNDLLLLLNDTIEKTNALMNGTVNEIRVLATKEITCRKISKTSNVVEIKARA